MMESNSQQPDMTLQQTLFEEVIEQGEQHIASEYADFPEYVPVLVKSLNRLMEMVRTRLVTEMAEETRTKVIKR